MKKIQDCWSLFCNDSPSFRTTKSGTSLLLCRCGKLGCFRSKTKSSKSAGPTKVFTCKVDVLLRFQLRLTGGLHVVCEHRILLRYRHHCPGLRVGCGEIGWLKIPWAECTSRRRVREAKQRTRKVYRRVGEMPLCSGMFPSPDQFQLEKQGVFYL